ITAARLNLCKVLLRYWLEVGVVVEIGYGLLCLFERVLFVTHAGIGKREQGAGFASGGNHGARSWHNFMNDPFERRARFVGVPGPVLEVPLMHKDPFVQETERLSWLQTLCHLLSPKSCYVKLTFIHCLPSAQVYNEWIGRILRKTR